MNGSRLHQFEDNMQIVIGTVITAQLVLGIYLLRRGLD